MKYSPESNQRNFPDDVELLLTDLREQRNFDPNHYVEAKSKSLNRYMQDAGLRSCVVAVSGGIDSAAVLGLVNKAAQQKGSPIERIIPVALPIFEDEYTKNQTTATNRARETCEAFGLKLIEIDLTKTYNSMKQAVDEAVGEVGEPWAAGQLVSYLRTPANYYVTSLTTQMQQGGIICGTTNRDEGAYLGFVGKASDGIVDVQLISDLHKSEVIAVSNAIGVPQNVIDAVPTGDMYDGRVDEEVFGASYDHVELLLRLKSLDPSVANLLLSRLSESSRSQLELAFKNLEELHSYNAHKYNVGSVAHHLDVLESGVPGGWTYSAEKVPRTLANTSGLVNLFNLSDATLSHVRDSLKAEYSKKEMQQVDVQKTRIELVAQTLGPSVIRSVLNDVDEAGWQPVGVDGIASHYKQGDEIGSLRATVFSPEIADLLWSNVAPHLDMPLIFGSDPQVDVEPDSIWRPIGISPVHRLIRYDDGGKLVPHYDAPYQYPDEEDVMTLKSLVVYLEHEGVRGGATRFLKDDRIQDPVSRRDHSDRQEYASGSDVIVAVEPIVGQGLLFDHRVLHDSEGVEQLINRGRKVILRTDIVYKKCS